LAPELTEVPLPPEAFPLFIGGVLFELFPVPAPVGLFGLFFIAFSKLLELSYYSELANESSFASWFSSNLFVFSEYASIRDVSLSLFLDC
jgi:hypothetical protein